MNKMNVLRVRFVELWVDVFRSSVTDYEGICSDRASLDHFLKQSAVDGLRGLSGVGLMHMAMAFDSDRAAVVYRFAEASRGVWDIVSGVRPHTTPRLLLTLEGSDDFAQNADHISYCTRISQFYQKNCDLHLAEFNRSIERLMSGEYKGDFCALSPGLIARCVFEALSPLTFEHGVDSGCIVYFANLHSKRMNRAFPQLTRIVDREEARSRIDTDPIRTDSGFMVTVPQRLW